MHTSSANSSRLRLRPVSVAIMSLLVSGGARAWGGGPSADDSAPSVEFNEAFLQQTGGGQIDLSRFSKGNAALPGQYRADIVVNEQLIGRGDVTLRAIDAAGQDAQPCFDRALLERIGIDLGKLTPEALSLLQAGDGRCVILSELVEGATASFDNGEQQLLVSAPQVSMSRQARGYVDPQFWDDGVTAARLEYSANAYRSEFDGGSSTQGFLGLNAGFNAGPWRLRHVGNLTYDSGRGDSNYQSVQTYAQRSIARVKGQLTLGDAFTDGTVFDSFGFRGAQLASDDRMYPDSQRGYAPTVHGIANSNARVQIRQNGNIIYETTVPAGAFAIDDLYPTGYGGDLEVIVTEADGSVRVSRVPYAPAVNALRPGVTRFGLTAGQYRDETIGSTPYVFQGQFQHGFSNVLTGYGGVVASEDYAAAALGAAFNTKVGAIGLDVTQAQTRLKNQPDRNGQSVRLSYSKLVSPTNTNIALAAYRYSGREFLTLREAVALRELDDRLLPGSERPVERGRLQLTLNQALPQGYGSIYLTGFRQDYWNRRDAVTQYQAGYNNNFRRMNIGLSASRQFDVTRARWDNQVMLTVGIPLGSNPRAPYSTTSVQKQSSGATVVQEAITGSAGEDGAFSYGVNAMRSYGGDDDNVNSLGANAAYAAPFATLSGSASKSGEYRQASAGISGGIVAYGGGVVFTPSLGDTVAIVEAKGAGGARVVNGSGLRLDRWGHAVASSLQPFSSNNVEIDPKGLPINVELQSTQQQATPTAGAITLVRFDTASAGRAAILRARRTSGEPVPFGAEVVDDAGQGIGTVAQGGRIIARGLPNDSGELTARWGSDAGQSCRLTYALPAQGPDNADAYTFADTVCK